MDELTDLVLAARRGDSGAFDAFVHKTQADVWRFCARMTDAQRADDLQQETYLRAWKSLSSFRGESRARTWLLGVAANVVADHVRRGARRSRLLSTAGFSAHSLETPRSPRDVPAESDRVDELATLELLEGLDLPQRVAFVLTQVIGCSYAETAAITGVPVGTVRSRVARARDHLVGHYRRAVAQ